MVAEVAANARRRSWTTGTPTDSRLAAGPMPDRSRIWGEPMAPPLRTISSAAYLEQFAAALHPRADGPVALDDEAVHEAVGAYREVHAMPRRLR